jgi:hypothetical protein
LHALVILLKPLIELGIKYRPAKTKKRGYTPMGKENSQSTTKKIINLSKQAHKLNKEGRYKAAEDIFNLALNLDDNNVYVLVGLGDLNRKI